MNGKKSLPDLLKKHKKIVLIAAIGLVVICAGVVLAITLGGETPPEAPLTQASPVDIDVPDVDVDAPFDPASPPSLPLPERDPADASPSDLDIWGQIQVLTAEEAKERMESGDPFILIDVRTEEEFNEGHIPGALSIPVEELAERAGTELLDWRMPILLYCRTGRRSDEAAQLLIGLGYWAVYDFGGIEDWPFDIVTG